MKLPFLKKKRLPRVESKPPDEKLVGGSADDHLSLHLFQELRDAVENHDVKRFRSALEALVLSCFEEMDDGKQSED